MVKNVTQNMSAKQVRMSGVAFFAALMTLAWATVDQFKWFVPTDVFVSATTALVMALVMLFAQFYDRKKSGDGTDA